MIDSLKSLLVSAPVAQSALICVQLWLLTPDKRASSKAFDFDLGPGEIHEKADRLASRLEVVQTLGREDFRMIGDRLQLENYHIFQENVGEVFTSLYNASAKRR